MNTPTVQKQFSFESDIPYEDIRSRACANLDLDPANAELGYKITGLDRRKVLPASLSSRDDFLGAMDRICGLISRARTKEYGIEIINLVSPQCRYYFLSLIPYVQETCPGSTSCDTGQV